jgi:hypothetical protein
MPVVIDEKDEMVDLLITPGSPVNAPDSPVTSGWSFSCFQRSPSRAVLTSGFLYHNQLVRANSSRTLPLITIGMRNCGQTMARPASRKEMDWPRGTKCVIGATVDQGGCHATGGTSNRAVDSCHRYARLGALHRTCAAKNCPAEGGGKSRATFKFRLLGR